MTSTSIYAEYNALQTSLQYVRSADEFRLAIMRLNEFLSSGQRDEIYPIFHPRLKVPVYLRRGTSDFQSFLQIFVGLEYSGCIRFVPNNIIDLGSYVGLSAVYFANRFPDAKIVCVEPSSDNYEMLRLNTRAYPNIELIHAGVWSHNAKLKIVAKDEGDWATTVSESATYDKDTIDAITISDIVDLYKLESIDFLKVDIEGSEREIFSCNTDTWIELVKAVACETHDRFLDGCTAAYEQAFQSRDFDSFQSGEFRTFVKTEFNGAVVPDPQWFVV